MGFVAMLLSVIGLIHAYLWKRLVRDTTEPGRGRLRGTLLLLALFALTLSALFTRTAPPDVGVWFAWPGFLWLATMVYLMVALLALELPRLATVLTLRRRHRALPAAASTETAVPETAVPETEVRHAGAIPTALPAAGDGGTALADPPRADPPRADATQDDAEARTTYLDRRRFMARGFAVAAGVAAAGTVGYGTYTALGPPAIRRVPITLPRLNGAFDGFRIAVVSDIHLGSLRGRGHTERIVRTINGLRPDMIAVVGDLVDGTVDELGHAVAPLRDLEAEHGAFFVTGNHEYYSGAGPWVEEIRGLGLRPLLNERVEITRGNAAFDLAGVEDVTAAEQGGGPDYARALAGRDTGRAVVMLAHQPVLATESAKHGVDLQLSGHTHGGQLWPFHYIVRAAQGTIAGRATIGETELYVTRGAGFWGPPVRVGAPPEVSLIQLDAAS